MKFYARKFNLIIPGLFFLAGCIGILLAAFTTQPANLPASDTIPSEAAVYGVNETDLQDEEILITPEA